MSTNSHIQPLESRHLLSVSLVHEATTSGFASLFAGSDGVYTGGWSTDGSLAGQRGSIGGDEPFFSAWNGGMLTHHRPSSHQVTRFSSGRESPFHDVALSPPLRTSWSPSFAPEDAVTIGRYKYFLAENQILRTRGDLSSATTGLTKA